jgi:hypothetical protein
MEYLSKRGLPLMVRYLPKVPTITVEDYGKWYDLYLVLPDGTARVYEFHEYEKHANSFGGTSWSDHVVNPAFVQYLSEWTGYEVDNRSFEVIVGRWVRQVEDRF